MKLVRSIGILVTLFAHALGNTALGARANPSPGDTAADAQQTDQVTLAMRVISAEPGRVLVDRGSADGLALDLRVTFRPRQGASRTGRVVHVDERSAIVAPDDPHWLPPPGMRCEAQIAAPAEPVREPDALVEPVAVPPLESVPASDAPEHPPWQREPDGWTQDEPLLARVRAFRPAERPGQLSGSAWASAELWGNPSDDRTDAFARAGLALRGDNLLGNGERLAFEAEWNRFDTDVPDGDGDRGDDLRLDRLSYAWGGDRFASNRYEVGRFLHAEFPELGVLDGAEWTYRLTGGSRFGGSAGFLPEWDTLEEHGDDAQLAAWYRWARDESAELSLGAAYQKSFHHADADRDLFVLDAHWLPRDAWTFEGTAWIDAYSSSDDAKGAGVEVTQAWLAVDRRWRGGSSLRVTYRHLAFPETDREEFLPVTQEQLADDHLDRAALDATQRFGTVAVREVVGAWADEDDEGGDAQLGFEVDDVFVRGSRLTAAAFATEGRFTSVRGWRASIGGRGAGGGWRVGYELTNNDMLGFGSDDDDLPVHRPFASVDWLWTSGWSLAARGDLLLFDDETGYAVALYLQRSF